MTDITPRCTGCGEEKAWVECNQCEDGMAYHDCGEDSCCCLNPEPNMPCDICQGECGWYACLKCADPVWVNELISDGRVCF